LPKLASETRGPEQGNGAVISVVFGEVEPGLGEPPVNIRRRLSTTPPRTCVCGTRLGPIPLRHLTTQIFRVFEAPAVAATYAPKWAFPKTQTFLRNGIKRPISAASVRPGTSHVFRHALQCTRLPYVLAESGLRRGERVRRRESDGRNPTFLDTHIKRHGFRAVCLQVVNSANSCLRSSRSQSDSTSVPCFICAGSLNPACTVLFSNLFQHTSFCGFEECWVQRLVQFALLSASRRRGQRRPNTLEAADPMLAYSRQASRGPILASGPL
jgi:hypothetical protein